MSRTLTRTRIHRTTPARDLLHAAGETIAVEPGGPIPLPQRRPVWPALAAAAAVVVLVVGAVLLRATGTEGTGEEPAGVPTLGPVEQALADRTVPPLIGYTEEEATELLREAGLEVEVRLVPEMCQAEGYVNGSAPIAGARWQPGDRVQLWVTGSKPTVDCMHAPPWPQIWKLVRYARGIGPEPRLRAGAEVEAPAAELLGSFVTETGPGEALGLRTAPDEPLCACPSRNGHGRGSPSMPERNIDGIVGCPPYVWVAGNHSGISAVTLPKTGLTNEPDGAPGARGPGDAGAVSVGRAFYQPAPAVPASAR